MEFVNINGKMTATDNAFLRIDDHSYRYGDGLFETMKVVDEKILLSDLHFERLFRGLEILRLQTPHFFTSQKLEREIVELCCKNHCEKSARVRLSVSSGNGGLYDNNEKLNYLMECWPLEISKDQLNSNGLSVGIFPGGKKSPDVFSNLKTSSHLVYASAARFANENKWNDCLILNTYDRICDSTIANIFWIKDSIIYTSPLTEGCIDGVMRRDLARKLKTFGDGLREKVCTARDLEEADEIFLSNAIKGIRWVGIVRFNPGNNADDGANFDVSYENKMVKKIVSHVFG